MNTGSQIHDWLGSAQYDLDSAEEMLDSFRYSHCLVMCGNCIDKTVKALWVKVFEEHPPAKIRLSSLLKGLEIPLDESNIDLLAVLSQFMVPVEDPSDWKALRQSISKEIAQDYFKRTERFIEWIKPRLR